MMTKGGVGETRWVRFSGKGSHRDDMAYFKCFEKKMDPCWRKGYLLHSKLFDQAPI